MHKERKNLVDAVTTNASFLMELYEEIDEMWKKNSFLMDKEIDQLRKKMKSLAHHLFSSVWLSECG